MIRLRPILACALAGAALPAISHASITAALGQPGADVRGDAYSNAGYGFYTPVTGTRINRLGYWDQGGDGLAISHDVMIVRYNGGSAYAEVVRATIPAGTTARLEGGYRWVDIPETVLPDIGQGADFYGIVASHGTDLWTETLGPAVPMNSAIGTVVSSFVGAQNGGVSAASLQPLGNRPGGWGGANFGFENLAPIPEKRLKILPLGDSITVGYTDNPNWNMAFEFGYRGPLAQLLTEAGIPFHFVGGSPEPFTNTSGDPTKGGTVYPVNELRDPQIDQGWHRAYGGIGLDGVNSQVTGWLNADNPDVILLMLGINGISSNSPSQLTTLVNTIYTAKPDVAIILAQIMPMASYNGDVVAYNTYIRDTLVPTLQGQGKKITTVDQYKNFLTNPSDNTSIDTAKFSNGINHPTNAAYQLMAQTWFPALASLALDESSIPADVAAGESIATLRNPDAPAETLTYSLASGAGDTDNAKFTIQGNQLRAGSHRFDLDPPGRTYDIRVTATGSVDGPLTQQFVLGKAAPTTPDPLPVLITPASSGNETAFAGDVRSDDLLHGLSGTHLNYKFLTGLPGPQINDGQHGAAGATAAIAWASDGNHSSSTYYLGSGNGAGYDVSSVSSIAAWTNAGFMNQKYKVSVRFAGATRFTPQPDCLVDYQPVTNVAANGPAGSTKVVITRPGGTLFRNIDAIRFTILDTNSQQNGGVTMREIDVMGVASAIAEPVILSFDTATLAGGVASLTWSSNLGKTYKIETSSTLSPPWTVLQPTYPSEGFSTDYSDTTVDPLEKQRFYRITENP